MRLFVFVIILISTVSVSWGQNNMLGSTYRYVFSKLNEDPEFSSLTVDTLSSGNIALKCKSSSQYPYYIYEFSEYDECVSYTVVSNNRHVFDTFMDFLNTVGSLVTYSTDRKVFQVRTMGNETVMYSISEPYKNSELMTKRSVFYVQIEKKIL